MRSCGTAAYILASFITLFWSPAAVRADVRADVRVTKRPAAVDRLTFDPTAPPPPGMPPLKAGEAAVTTYRFDCETILSATSSQYKLAGGGCRTTLTVENVRLVLSLRVTVWLPEGASDRLVAHEEGHREIAERAYEAAEAAARKAADRADGRKVIGEGEDCAKVANDRLNDLGKWVGEQYRSAVVEPTKRVQDAYDELTAHGTRTEPPPKDAVRSAFERGAAEDGPSTSKTTRPTTRSPRSR